MTTLKVGIATYEQMKARTLAIARGELRPKPGDPKVWFTSAESFARLLSNRNRALSVGPHRPDAPRFAERTGCRHGPHASQLVAHAAHHGALWPGAAA
jgi:predicted transcriptional regulator